VNFHDGGRKDVVVILNGVSLEKKRFYHNILPSLLQLCNVEVVETLSKNDAISIASGAAGQYVDLILAAGGDGTLHQVVNGVLKGRESETKLPVIGLIPIGSGNDFARTAGIKAEADQLKKLITAFSPKKIDVGLIHYTPFAGADLSEKTAERYFINVADIGMGPVVVDKVLKSGRPFGHGAAYYLSIISTFIDYKPMPVKVTTRHWTWQGKLRTLGVANGKYYGHGLCIAPDALADDRMFSVFICGNVSVFDFVKNTDNLKKGRYIDLKEVFYKSATQLEFTSETPCMIEGDGEILGLLPARVELIERQLDFLI
jgi:diacylglycerol kinase (ATP)